MADFVEYTHTEHVEAYKCDSTVSVVTSQGIVFAGEGDYVVKRDKGIYVMECDTFENRYELVNTTPKKNGGSPNK